MTGEPQAPIEAGVAGCCAGGDCGHSTRQERTVGSFAAGGWLGWNSRITGSFGGENTVAAGGGDEGEASSPIGGSVSIRRKSASISSSCWRVGSGAADVGAVMATPPWVPAVNPFANQLPSLTEKPL